MRAGTTTVDTGRSEDVDPRQVEKTAKDERRNEHRIKTREAVQQIDTPRRAIDSNRTEDASPNQISAKDEKYDDPLMPESCHQIGCGNQHIMVWQLWIILEKEIAQAAQADADGGNSPQRIEVSGRGAVRSAGQLFVLCHGFNAA